MSSLSSLTNPANVAKAIKDQSSKQFILLKGTLGAIEKGGQTIKSDESTSQKASRYLRIFNGIENQKIGTKEIEEIAELIKRFAEGP